MNQAAPATGRDRSARTDHGWFVAAQVLLALLAVVYPQLGARESASSILPPIRVPVETAGPAHHAEEAPSADGDVDTGVAGDRAAPPSGLVQDRPTVTDQPFGPGRADEAPPAGRPDSAPSRGPPPAS